MKKNFRALVKTLSLGTLISLSAWADDSGLYGEAPAARALPRGAYKATAFGTSQDQHGYITGYYVDGFGKTPERARANALERCKEITQGQACRIVR